ncbi:ubiquitin carboxyl-terminal hydrolase 8-like [Yasminevirus sp. GU-2018]|uniref:Ubiquitin carboxyl-terminal hydrolase 8-like n=1 Tax=Yasminevirus sp. GU-2018 TaxID=2420051 RepID=A0A5K0UBY6_9VIRU|nr:ubiquitin carboxyl-terminal hydrolase 8-like [Yasminevirus sp. GU-2018]
MTTVVNLRGFRNLGNTCYMNAGLQALLSSNVLNTALMMYLKENQQTLKQFSPMLIEYCRIIIDLLKKNQPAIYSPIEFKKTLDRVNQWFRGYQQHDSNELFLYLINDFIDETKDKGVVELIKKLCFGKYKQYVYCNECKNVVESYFNFLDVALPIPETNNPDLEDCFKKFAKYDTLDESNKWDCPTCKKKVIAHKKMEIHEVPDVAVFTLNRFKGTTKNNTPVRIYPYIELEGKKLRLISTVNHYGGTGGGHYVAHVSRSGKWYMADDSSIREINSESVLNDPSVYMVVYQVVC